ncbi:MAG: hypothetical protein AABZ06_05880 [Bdellovibrionota bacterium]
MFERLGYACTDSREHEIGFDKVAIFVLDGAVTHAARQLPSGKWSSKLGPNHDIEHTITGLDGHRYGAVAQVMKRPMTAMSQ